MKTEFNIPAISVIMSVYSEPIEWIVQSIDSILRQTFTDFEFIIVNDNPSRPENTQLLNSMQDDRVKIIHNPTNIGLPASLNKALDVAQGKYVARMDADDISLPNRFAEQYDFLESHSEYGICGTYACFIDEYSKVGKKIRLGKTDNELKARLLFYSPFMHPSVMARKELIYRLKYDESFKVAQDVELWLRMSSETRFYNIPKILLYYRIHTQNYNSQKRNNLLQNIHKELARKRFELFCPASINEEIKNIFINFTSPKRERVVTWKDIDSLFSFLLVQTRNDKNIYGILFNRYISELQKGCTCKKLFDNPFLKDSYLKYFCQWMSYINSFFL